MLAPQYRLLNTGSLLSPLDIASSISPLDFALDVALRHTFTSPRGAGAPRGPEGPGGPGSPRDPPGHSAPVHHLMGNLCAQLNAEGACFARSLACLLARWLLLLACLLAGSLARCLLACLLQLARLLAALRCADHKNNNLSVTANSAVGSRPEWVLWIARGVLHLRIHFSAENSTCDKK